MRAALLFLLLVLGCSRAQPDTRPSFPALPDTVYTQSGATPVLLVDSIFSAEPGKLIIGQYWFTIDVIYVSRQAQSEKLKRKVVEHERCHKVLHESGLAIHISPALAELLCDALANARVAEIERLLSYPGR